MMKDKFFFGRYADDVTGMTEYNEISCQVQKIALQLVKKTECCLLIDGTGSNVHLVGSVAWCPDCGKSENFDEIIIPGDRVSLSCGCMPHQAIYNKKTTRFVL